MDEEKTIIRAYETIKKYCESHYPDCSECCFSRFCLMAGTNDYCEFEKTVSGRLVGAGELINDI